MEPIAEQQVQDPGGGHDSSAESLETPPDRKGQTAAPEQQLKPKRPLKPLSKRKVKDYNEGLAKRGVVYLSRVPPFMKPAKVKHLMEQHGVVTRVSEPQRWSLYVRTASHTLTSTKMRRFTRASGRNGG